MTSAAGVVSVSMRKQRRGKILEPLRKERRDKILEPLQKARCRKILEPAPSGRNSCAQPLPALVLRTPSRMLRFHVFFP